jgi:hypothetical protein
VTAAKVPVTSGLQLIDPLYWVASRLITGVAPTVGAVTPGIAKSVIVAAEVEGKTAVTTPELALWVTLIEPSTVKLSAVTPLRVHPDFGVRVMVAV